MEQAAQAVLDAMALFQPGRLLQTTSGQYAQRFPGPPVRPNTMLPVLVKAHQQFDRAVDLCYRPQPFINETKRIKFLFELYDTYTAGLFVKEKKVKKKKG